MSDTLHFLDRVLPQTDFTYMAETYTRRDGSTSFKHTCFATHGDAADFVDESNREKRNVYYACASYREPVYKTNDRGNSYLVGRVKSNVEAAKDLWEDIDVGKTTVPSYECQRAAAKDIFRGCREVGIPLPMLVSSGVGLHAHWVLKDVVSPANWTELARYKAICLRHAGLKIDPSRSNDLASVLRPVGATRMVNGHARIVRIIQDAEDNDYNDLLDRFQHYANKFELIRPKQERASVTPTPETSRITAALSQIDPNPYATWLKVAMCLAALRDHLGNSGRDMWLAFSDSADDDAKRNNDNKGTDPEQMFDTLTPDMTADVALGALFALARDGAITTMNADRGKPKWSPAGQSAAQYLAAFHRRTFNQIVSGASHAY